MHVIVVDKSDLGPWSMGFYYYNDYMEDVRCQSCHKSLVNAYSLTLLPRLHMSETTWPHLFGKPTPS